MAAVSNSASMYEATSQFSESESPSFLPFNPRIRHERHENSYHSFAPSSAAACTLVPLLVVIDEVPSAGFDFPAFGESGVGRFRFLLASSAMRRLFRHPWDLGRVLMLVGAGSGSLAPAS
jgi:hypothetical protein